MQELPLMVSALPQEALLSQKLGLHLPSTVVVVGASTASAAALRISNYREQA